VLVLVSHKKRMLQISHLVFSLWVQVRNVLAFFPFQAVLLKYLPPRLNSSWAFSSVWNVELNAWSGCKVWLQIGVAFWHAGCCWGCRGRPPTRVLYDTLLLLYKLSSGVCCSSLCILKGFYKQRCAIFENDGDFSSPT